MLDVKLLREEPERVKKGIVAKNADPQLVDDFLALDEEWREGQAALDALRAEQHKLSESRDRENAKKNKAHIKDKEAEVEAIGKKRELVWSEIPNLPDDDVPLGKSEDDNKVLRRWGTPKKFNFKVHDHVELGEALGIIDVSRASEASGTRFAYLKGGAVLLEFALIQYALDVLRDQKVLKSLAEKVASAYSPKPFLPVVPPVMIRPAVFKKMARLNPGEEEERYYLSKDDLYLVGSAEHTLGPLHLNEIMEERELPVRYAGFSTSFRREAGSYGRDTRGILRVHQFDKLEIESFTTPENSRKEQDFIVSLQEHLMQSLEIPYQVVAICTGDMSAPDARQIDIEAWLPGQGKYRETHTSDLVTDYQARRLGTKVRRSNGEIQFVHMNDATVFAIGRTLIAILENYQMKDGKVQIPEVLQEYVGEKVIG